MSVGVMMVWAVIIIAGTWAISTYSTVLIWWKGRLLDSAIAVVSCTTMILLVFVLLYGTSGQPRPHNLFGAYVHAYEEAQILSHVLREDEGIYLWVMDTRNPDAEPLSLKLPWSDATAQALSDAKGDADGPQGEGDLFMEWSQEPSLNDVPQFYGRPWPALPNKPGQEPALRVPERAT